MLSRLPRSWIGRVLGVLLAAVLAAPGFALAQTDQAGAGNPFSAEQLEQIAAPIALYPDPLVAQVLMASTYPLEVVQAARFAKANANLKGAQLDEALKQQTWDDRDKFLVAVPSMLGNMNKQFDWYQNF